MVNPLQTGGEIRAGERAFSPTPAEPALQFKVWVDLSDLPLSREVPAAKILKSILRNYNVDIKILLSIGSDGLDVIIIKDYYNITRKTFMRREENNERAIKRIAKELARRKKKDIIVMMLYNGFETAVAFATTKDRYVINMVRE